MLTRPERIPRADRARGECRLPGPPVRPPGLRACGLLALFLASCGPDSGGVVERSGTPLVVCTTGMIADVARALAGDRVEVRSLMAPGIDPHLYKATAGDVRTLSSADLILYNGLHLEGKMGEILEKMARTRPVVAVTDDIPRDRLLQPPAFSGAYDPHVWFDVRLWMLTLDRILAELIRLDPAGEGEFRRKAESYRQELASLDARVESEIRTIPDPQRILVTAHDAFGYFGRRYGIEVLGLQGISTVSQAGIRDIERVVNVIFDRRVRAIFVESSVPRRNIEAVQEACRERGHEVRIGGELFSDSMGAPGTPEGTYVGMVEHNVETIVRALR